MEPIRSHDALFRFVFGEPEQMAELLRGVLPAAVVAAIDWSSLVRIDGTFVDADLSTRHADLLFEARMGGEPVLIHVVVEHKSGSYRFTALQTLRYRVRIWDRWQKDHPDARSLPPVLAVVVHHGDVPWTAPRSLRDLVHVGAVAPEVAQFVRAQQPDASFLLDDLAAASEEGLTARSLSVVSDLTIRFLQFLHQRPAAEAADAIARWQEALRTLLGHPRGQDVMTALLSWLLAGVPHGDPPLRTALVRIRDAKTRQSMKSQLDDLLDRGFAKGLKKGRQEGRQAGRQEGLHEGRMQALLQLLQIRFGKVPRAIEKRVRAGTGLQVEQWLVRTVTAPALAAVFEDV